jgi:hypothetical protein
MRTFELPPSESWRKNVSLLLRYGTWPLPPPFVFALEKKRKDRKKE